MKVTLNSLKKFMKFYSKQSIELAFNNLGFEVESVLDASVPFKVVEITAIRKHKNSERLNVCYVSDGIDQYTVVCGASNVYVGMKTVFAAVGAYISSAKFFIAQSKIRDEDSEGMLCSASELEISEFINNGIIDLPSEYIVGEVFMSCLSDVVYELSITPNRGDALSVYGLAQELCAYGLGEMRPLEDVILNVEKVSFIRDNAARQAYFARINNIEANKVDEEMRAIMRFVDLKLISYPVDVTNYIAYLYGQPLHVYGLEKDYLYIGRNQEGKFLALDENSYELLNTDVVIYDEEVHSLAGIMGGQKSMYNGEFNVLIEAALFYESDIRRTGGRLKIISEARKKYERFVSEYLIQHALNHALQMLGGEVLHIVYDCVERDKDVIINYDLAKINSLAGFEVDINILKRLNFQVNSLEVHVHNRRAKEIQTNADLTFEILRLYGFENLPNKLLKMTLNNYKPDTIEKDLIFKTAARGYNEVTNFCFIEDPKNTKVYHSVLNSIAGKKYMRTSMLPDMLANIQKTKYSYIFHEKIKAFEYGYIFSQNEHEVLTLMQVGKYKGELNFAKDYTFYDLKKDVMSILSSYDVEFVSTASDVHEDILDKIRQYAYHNFIVVNNKVVGILGHVSVDLSYEGVYFAEIFVNELQKPKKSVEIVECIYPVVIRDFSFIYKDDIGYILKNIQEQIKEVRNILLYDQYGASKTIKVYIQSSEKTLSGEEIEVIYNKILKILSVHNISLR